MARVQAGVTVIGLGNWGASLLAGLRSAGVPVPEVVHAAPQSSKARSSREAVALEKARLDARVLFLCVPDAAIASVAASIAVRRRSLRGQIIVHASGALSSTVLHAAANAGAAVASVHPLMSFPSRKPVSLRDVPFGVETGDAAARRSLFALVRKLGGKPFALPTQGKALYHAAGTLASPFLASLMASAIGCCQAAGLSRAEAMTLLGPIARRTVENIFRDGPERSFSGPVARGDVATLSLHLQALEQHPLWAAVYRSLLAASLDTLPAANVGELRALLAESSASVRATPRQM